MKNLFLSIIFLLVTDVALAVPAFFNYEGVLEDSSGNLLTSQTVSIVFRIRTTTNGCTLYAESQNISTNAYGEFVAKIGAGSRSGGYGDPGWSMLQIFNQAAGSQGACTFVADEPRQLEIFVNGVGLSPMITIGTSPLAVYAEASADSAKLNSFPDTAFVKHAQVSTCSGGQFLSYAGGTFSCAAPSSSGITSLGGLTSSAQTFSVGNSGSSPQISSAGAVHTLNIPMANAAGTTAGLISKSEFDSFNSKLGSVAGTSLTAGNIWVGNASSVATAFPLTGDANITSGGVLVLGTVAVNKGGTGITTTPSNGKLLIGNGTSYTQNTITGTTNQIIVANGSGTITLSTPQSIDSGAAPQFAGLGLGAANSTASAILELTSTTKGLLIPRMTTAQRNSIAAPVVGLQVYDTDSNNIFFYNGSVWQSVSGGGGGITSLNALSSTNQTFAIGTGGTSPAWNSSGSIHTLDIPMASAAGTTAGLVSKTDYDSFNSKLGPSTSFGGVVTGLYNALTLNSGVVHSSALQNDSVTSAKILDGTIVDADILSVGRNKIAPGSPYGIAVNNNTGYMSEVLGTTNGTILQHGTFGPIYSSASYPSATAANQFLFSSAANVIGTISTAPNSFLVTNNSGSPEFKTGIGNAPQMTEATWQFSPADSSKPGLLSIVNSDFNNSTVGSGIVIGTFDGGTAPFTGVKPAVIQSLVNGNFGGELELNPAGGVVVISNNASLGVRTNTPTAYLHLGSGTVSTPPLKFTSGALTGTAQQGSVEFDGNDMFFTDNSSFRRKIMTAQMPLENQAGSVTLGSCMGGSVVGNLTRGEVTMGTGNACQITFSASGPVPICTLTPVQDMNTIRWWVSGVNASSFTVSLSVASTGSKFNYTCIR